MATTGSSSAGPEIGKDDLMKLTMKMKKRMEALEGNRVELMKKTASLLSERRHLLDLLKGAAPIPVSPVDEEDLNMSAVDTAWKKWDENRQAELEKLSRQLSESEQQRARGASISSPCGDSAGGAVGAGATVAASPTLSELAEVQSRLRKADSEVEKLRATDVCLKQQVTELEKSLATKSQALETSKKELGATRAQLEEKVLLAQMEVNSLKATVEARDREAAASQQHVKTLSTGLEEKTLALNSHKEIVSALQTQLAEIEPELERSKRQLQEQLRQTSAQTLQKAEQDALLTSMRRDLKAALESREALSKQVKSDAEFKNKYDVVAAKAARLEAQASDLEADKDEKVATITRLRTEAQVSERNHAMRTAMLATCEAQLEAIKSELQTKSDTAKVAVERASTLQQALSAAEARLAERVAEASKRVDEAQAHTKAQAAEFAAKHSAVAAEHDAALEAVRRDFTKKSNMARALVSEKEEEVRVLSARVQELQAEISSGAPSERRIFELARVQSQREATHSLHSDTREVAFQQLQSALSSKDLQLAQAQSSQSALTAEIAELRRTVRREGVNMDYLKNIVHQVRASSLRFDFRP